MHLRIVLSPTRRHAAKDNFVENALAHRLCLLLPLVSRFHEAQLWQPRFHEMTVLEM